MGKFRKITLFLFLLILSVNGSIRAEDKAYNESFDINSIDLNEPVAQKFIPLLKNYFFCSAIQKNNINECDKLSLGEGKQQFKENCEEKFRYFNEVFKVFSDIFVENLSVLDLKKKCRSIFSGRKDNDSAGIEDTCLGMIKAVKQSDVSFCPKDGVAGSNCRGIISGNKSLMADYNSRDLIPYLDAYKNLAPQKCEGIVSNYNIERGCKNACVYLTSEEGSCEQDAGFKEFRKQYSQAFLKKGVKNE